MNMMISTDEDRHIRTPSTDTEYQYTAVPALSWVYLLVYHLRNLLFTWKTQAWVRRLLLSYEVAGSVLANYLTLSELKKRTLH